MSLTEDRDQSTTWNVILGLDRLWSRTINFVDEAGDPYPVLAGDVDAVVHTSPADTPILVTQGGTDDVLNFAITAAALGGDKGAWEWEILVSGSQWFAGTFQLTDETLAATSVQGSNTYNVTVGDTVTLTAVIGPGGGGGGGTVLSVDGRIGIVTLDDLYESAGTTSAAITALINGASAAGDTLGELEARLAVIEALGSLATDAELVAAVADLLGSADTDGDTLGELQALINTRALDAAVVKLTGDQSVDGVKTFTSSPIVPAPTTDFQVATKKYVDDTGTNLTLFSGVGDGSTVETAALQAAITAAAGGKLVTSAGKSYVIDAAIDIPSDTVLDFQGSTVKVADGTSKNVSAVRIMGQSDIVLRNLVIDANRSNRSLTAGQPAAADEIGSGNGLALRADGVGTYSSDILIENVDVIGAPLYGISLRGCERVRVQNCTVDGFGDDGIECGAGHTTGSTPARMVTIVGCVSRNGVNTYSDNCNGFEIDDGGHNITITACLAEDNYGGGFQVHPHETTGLPHDITITGCVSRNNGPRGIRVDTTAAGQIPYNITITGNVVSGATTGVAGDAAAITVRGAKSVVVANNACDGAPIIVAGGGDGITIEGNHASNLLATTDSRRDLTGLMVKGNRFTSSTVAGISARGTSPYNIVRPVIEGNIVNTPTTHGIIVERVDGAAVINGNRVTNPGNQCLYAFGVATSEMQVSGNHFTRATETGTDKECVYVTAPFCSIVGNTLTGGQANLRLGGSAFDTIIQGNTMRLANVHALDITSPSRAIISGNIISKTVGTGHAIYGTGNDLTITGNYITTTTVASRPINQGGSGDYWTVTGNNYRTVTTAAAFVGANNVVANNRA